MNKEQIDEMIEHIDALRSCVEDYVPDTLNQDSLFKKLDAIEDLLKDLLEEPDEN